MLIARIIAYLVMNKSKPFLSVEGRRCVRCIIYCCIKVNVEWAKLILDDWKNYEGNCGRNCRVIWRLRIGFRWRGDTGPCDKYADPGRSRGCRRHRPGGSGHAGSAALRYQGLLSLQYLRHHALPRLVLQLCILFSIII